MTKADKVTLSRLIMAPIFYVLYFLPIWTDIDMPWLILPLWLLFIAGEVSDLIDGWIARARNEVSDFGKLFDPFADTLARVTYFLCFVVEGILPAFLFALILYREFSILFLRTLMMRRGVALGARSGGKIKAVSYMMTGITALAAASVQRLGMNVAYPILHWGAVALFAISVVLSYSSFFDYFQVLRQTEFNSTENPSKVR